MPQTLTNEQNVADAKRLYKANILHQYKEVEQNLDPFVEETVVEASEIKATGATLNTRMEEILGERKITSPDQFGFIVEKKEYGKGVAIPQKSFRNKDYLQFEKKIGNMGAQAGKLKSRLAANVMEGTSPAKGYDGKKLGDTGHTIPGTDITYDNVSTAKLDRDALQTAENFFGSIKDENGEKIALTPTHILTSNTGAANRMAHALMNQDKIEIGGVEKENSEKGKYKHITNPHIENPNFWALICGDESDKAVLVFPSSDKPELASVTDDNDGYVVLNKKYLFTCDLEVGVVPGAWYCSYISDGSAV